MNKPTASLLWCDLETTGLEADVDIVLECAYVITDRDLNELARGSRVFRATPGDRFVQNMHDKNGLWAECASEDEYAGEGALDRFLLDAIEPFEWDGLEPADKADAKRLPILAGSTIRFDHGFLRSSAPSFANVIHYRQLDITATMLLAKSVEITFPKAEAHRAMADVLESLENARTCRAILRAGIPV